MEGYTSIPDIQAGLSMVFYLINTSRLDRARSTLHTITSSSIARSLSQADATQNSETQPMLCGSSRDVVWAMRYLDMHISSLLGVAPLHQGSTSTLHTIQAINTAAQNVANYKRSDTTFLLSVSLAMVIELLMLLQRIVPDSVATDTTRGMISSDALRNLQRWTDLEPELGTWEHLFQGVFPDDEVNLQIAL